MSELPPDTSAPLCATCAYYSARVFSATRELPPETPPPTAHDPGECRRYPPSIQPPYYRTRFPAVEPQHWCGEYLTRGTLAAPLPVEMS